MRPLALLALALTASCGSEAAPWSPAELDALAGRYVAAWSSGEPEQVAAFFAADGELIINDAPRIGRAEITAAARGYMAAYPDLLMTLDGIEGSGRDVRLRWTFTGTNTGPAGSGNAVHVVGREEWRLGDDGLIATSDATFRRGSDPVPPELQPR